MGESVLALDLPLLQARSRICLDGNQGWMQRDRQLLDDLQGISKGF